ncbi:MAG TPA: nitrite transporter NirC [Alphaproteobacteria bacterium]|nr:nitrite transporter NirC [Alphaproteobacteria bacterium]
MYQDTVDYFANLSVKKADYLRRSPFGFWISSMMAGAYVGIGIILIFCVASDIEPAYRALVMGTSFGIALTLVVFAGSDLFTGHTMYMSLGILRGRIGWSDLGSSWLMTWAGNLAGAALLAIIFVKGGGGAMLGSKSQFLMTVAAAKMNGTPLALFCRAVLCNWLVCLALWMAARMTNDTAKCIAIFWCLFGFIGSGYEHSIANMTIFAVALLGNHPATVSVGGMFHNLLWVTLGNIVSGAVFMGAGYWAASRVSLAPMPAGGPEAKSAVAAE